MKQTAGEPSASKTLPLFLGYNQLTIIMKSKLFILSSILGLIILISSCQSETTDPNSIHGIWTYTTLEGDYAELWIAENSMLSIRNPSPIPSVFDYTQNGDTIRIYTQGLPQNPKNPRGLFTIQSREGNKLVKMQDNIQTELLLIQEGAAELKETDEFEKEVIDAFIGRLSKKLN